MELLMVYTVHHNMIDARNGVYHVCGCTQTRDLHMHQAVAHAALLLMGRWKTYAANAHSNYLRKETLIAVLAATQLEHRRNKTKADVLKNMFCITLWVV